MTRALLLFPLVVLAACPQAGDPQAAPGAGGAKVAPGTAVTLERYSVELREKVNTCRELDPQVALETIFIQRYGAQGVLHLGAERAFPVQLEGDAIKAEFLETDHSTVDGRHVVCKRITDIDLKIAADQINGTYERKRRQECLLDAKPCFTTWTISGERAK